MRPEGAREDMYPELGQEYWFGQMQAFLRAFRIIYGKQTESLARALLDAERNIVTLSGEAKKEEHDV